jgi:hypothetical protein
MDPHKSMCNIDFFTEMISVCDIDFFTGMISVCDIEFFTGMISVCDIDFFTGMISVYHCIVSILNVYLALGLKRVTGKIF